MTPDEYRKAWQAHYDAYSGRGSNDAKARYRADLVMGLTELVEALNRIADNGYRKNEH